MRQFFRQFDFNWKMFPMYSAGFGLSMAHFHGWKTGIIEGLVFGLAMTLISGKRKETAINDEDLIVITHSKLLAYICAVGFWLFVLCFVGLALSLEGRERLILPPFFLGFALLSLYCFYSTSVQFLVGSSTIIRRAGFGAWSTKKSFRLHDVQTADVLWYQVLKLTFRSGKTLKLSAMNESLMHLRPYDGKVRNPQVEGLFRLKQEIMSRVARQGGLQSHEEIHKLDDVPFRPAGILAFATTGIFVAAIAAGLMSQSRTKGISKIRSEDQQAVRMNDVEGAFSIYKGVEFYKLKAEFESKCRSAKDFNCRLAYYFREVAKESGALDLIRISCSESDPQSCYNLYSDKLSTETDQQTAASILENVCQLDEHKTKTCCTCYQELKTKRSPAAQ